MLSGAEWQWWAPAGIVSGTGLWLLGVTGLAGVGSRGSRVGSLAWIGWGWVWLAVAAWLLWVLSIAGASGLRAQDGAVTQTPAAAARARANDEMERLRMEIRLLTELKEAQEALRDWNRLRVQAGEPEAVLDAELCGRLKEWCAALPGTFGAPGAAGKAQ